MINIDTKNKVLDINGKLEDVLLDYVEAGALIADKLRQQGATDADITHIFKTVLDMVTMTDEEWVTIMKSKITMKGLVS